MESAPNRERDVFIIYSKGDRFESKLVEAVKNQLYAWGLTAWVYEDWDWETEHTKPVWRSYGTQLDPLRYAAGHPQPFKHRRSEKAPDRDRLARMFDSCDAIVLVAPRGGGGFSAGAYIEWEVLNQTPHAAVMFVSWGDENNRLQEEISASFAYRMPLFPRDFRVPGESVARAAWLSCMMAGLFDCGAMGRDLVRQLARGDALLNHIARHSLHPVDVPLDPDPMRIALLSEAATADQCGPVLRFWLGGRGYAADQLTTGNAPPVIIEASKLMRSMLRTWCAMAQERFPVLAGLSSETSFSLGSTKLRLGKYDEAIADFTSALSAPDAGALTTHILLDRGLAWNERGFPGKAVDDFTAGLGVPGLAVEARQMLLHHRAIVWSAAGKYDRADADFSEILESQLLSPSTEALVLISRALARYHAGLKEQALADYQRILDLSKAPAEARIKALLNRGAVYADMNEHDAAIRDYNAVLSQAESEPRQLGLALFNRANSKSESGDKAGAREDYEAALQESEIDDHVRQEAEQRLLALKGELSSL